MLFAVVALGRGGALPAFDDDDLGIRLTLCAQWALVALADRAKTSTIRIPAVTGARAYVRRLDVQDLAFPASPPNCTRHSSSRI